MFGDITVNLQIKKDIYKLELGYNATTQDLFERFLQLTRYDPNLFDFLSEGRNILNLKTISQLSSNNLSDINIECQLKKDAKQVKILVKAISNNGKSKKIDFIIDGSKKDAQKHIVGMYFKLDPAKFTLEKKGDYYELSERLYLLDTNANGRKIKDELFYSKNATVLDLKYYASFISKTNCSQFFIGEKEYRNSIPFLSIADQTGAKYFREFQCTIYFKITGDNNVRNAILTGSPIGRNVKKAIAKAENRDAKKYKNVFLSIEKNGIHIPVDTFTKVKPSQINESSPFVYGKPFEITLNLFSGDESLGPLQMHFDPEVTFGQIRQIVSQMYQVDSPEFVKISNDSGNTPENNCKIEDYPQNPLVCNCIFAVPQQVEAFFILYNNKSFKQMKVSCDETNKSVLNRAAEKFQINPKSFCIWANNVQLCDSCRFFKNYLSETNYILAGKLKVEVTYQKSTSIFVLPLNIEFDTLSSICADKYGISNDNIGFYIQKSKSFDPVYEPWNGPFYPGPQYVSRYRNSEEMNYVKLIIKLKTDKPLDSSKVQIKVVIFENGEFVNDSCEVFSSAQLSKIIEPNSLTSHPKGLNTNSLFYINDKLCRPSMIINEAFTIGGDATVHIFPPGTIKYILPNEDKINYMVLDQSSTVNDMINKIGKLDKNISFTYNGQTITDLYQSIQFFDPQIPFKAELQKGGFYQLVYKNKGKEITEEIPVNSKTIISNIISSSCDLLNKETASSPRKAGKVVIKPTQIRVTINSRALTKDMERLNLVDVFGPSGKAEITKLERFCFTIQGQNLVSFHYSPEDTIQHARITMLKRWDVKDEDMDYYYLLVHGISAYDEDLLLYYMDDEDLCFDITPIQFTVKITAILPEFTNEFIISNDLILYNVKEYFATFYDLEDPDLVEIYDSSTNELMDDNDNFTNDQIVEVKLNADEPKLVEKIAKMFKKSKTVIAPRMDNNTTNISSNSDNLFSCPFRNQEEASQFNLDLPNDATCLDAKDIIAKFLITSSKISNSVLFDPDNILISIKNEKISDSELLKPKYLDTLSKDKHARFIIEANKNFNFSD